MSNSGNQILTIPNGLHFFSNVDNFMRDSPILLIKKKAKSTIPGENFDTKYSYIKVIVKR